MPTMSQPRTNPGQTLIFPVGHYQGPLYHESETTPKYYCVRIGQLVATLPDDISLAVWAAGHRPLEAGDRLWTRADVIAVARDQLGVSDPQEQIEDFLHTGLLVEVEPDPADAIGFATAHRMTPLLVGLGNSPDDPLGYGIGLVGMQPMARVSALGFDIYSWSAVGNNLWEVCQAVAEAGVEAEVGNQDDLDPTTVLLGFLTELQTLLAVNAVCLDEARGDE